MVSKWLTAVIAVVAIAALGWACGDDDEEETPGPTGGSPTVTEPGGLTGELEIFSWWITGGEAAGKQSTGA